MREVQLTEDFTDLAAIIRLKNPSRGQSMSPPARRFD
jgi:hypothetical protein